MRGLRFVARAISVAVAVAALSGAPMLPGVAAAQPGSTFVEVTPNTAQPGERVNIRASCDGSSARQSATVQSDAFGRVVLRPDNGFLTGSAAISDRKPPGSYGVTLQCTNNFTSTTTITVVNMSKPSQGPATGGGGTAGSGISPVILAAGIAAIAIGASIGLFGMRRRDPGTGA
jgi:hypothetical protein